MFCITHNCNLTCKDGVTNERVGLHLQKTNKNQSVVTPKWVAQVSSRWCHCHTSSLRRQRTKNRTAPCAFISNLPLLPIVTSTCLNMYMIQGMHTVYVWISPTSPGTLWREQMTYSCVLKMCLQKWWKMEWGMWSIYLLQSEKQLKGGSLETHWSLWSLSKTLGPPLRQSAE